MATITDGHAEFGNYHGDLHYLRSIQTIDSGCLFVNFESARLSIPLVKRIINSRHFDLFTPTGFQATVGKDVWHQEIDFIRHRLYQLGAVSCYIQTKDDLTSFEDTILLNITRKRTNYCLSLMKSPDEMMRSMARDSRQRLRKALKHYSYKVVNKSSMDDFVHHYARIAERNSFSGKYRLSHEAFTSLVHSSGVLYIELKEGGKFLSGGVFGIHNDEVDYLFGANNPEFTDSIRLLIWECLKFFKDLGFKRLFLGGGVIENDTLASFKLRLGSERCLCSTIRMIVNLPVAESLMCEPISSSWYDCFFPPYVANQ